MLGRYPTGPMAMAANGPFFTRNAFEMIAQEKRVIRFFLSTAVVLTLCSLLVVGCAPSSGPSAGSYVQITQPSFVDAWDVQLPLHSGDSVKGIYYLDGTIHVITNKSYDHAVKGDSGELLYNYEIGTADSQVQGAPTLVTDAIVFPTTHTLEVFTRTGNFIRSIDMVYTITNPIVGNNNYVYAGLDFNGGCLACTDVTLDLLPVQWKYLTFGSVDGRVAIQDNTIYSGSEDGKIRACLEDKSPDWPLLENSAFDTQDRIVSGLAADSHSIYCATLGGKFYSLDKDNGKLRWQYFSGAALEYGPQVTDSAVYQYVPGLGLTALDKSKKVTVDDQETLLESPFHTPRWSLPSAGRILGEDQQFVYVVLGRPDQTRGIAAVDKTSGKIVFRTHRRDLRFVTAQPDGSMIYGATESGMIVAMKPVAVPGSYGQIVDSNISSLAPTIDRSIPHVR
jgi:outer membrane protein assembly factor BamB